jgi:hypothetical protein
MALSEETVQDKIEIVGDYKHVQVAQPRSSSVTMLRLADHFTVMSLHQMLTSQVKALRYKPFALRYTQTPSKQPMLHI